ncbi:unnamed protein product [Adineta steineri]|uniref:G-protein coupled receptors family 1 profile domain-containing protein n=1 Tax=Adineta steineri TaxID=433720 RepID=A0A815CLR4_9BILA|nr:unnamed protein product [Adineta steineri]CAF1285440.1 unnamed protein product [Adineta steineri]CAF1453683.1 unnamed protein product [Adineta steineri]
MSSTDNYYIEILNNIPIYLHKYFVTFLYIIGNIGNLLAIFVFFKRSWRKNVCVFYFLVCLFSNTIFINSTLLGSIFTLGFNSTIQNSSVILCKFFYYVSYLTSTYYPIILILASIDRLLISSQNIDTRLYSSKRLAYFSTSIATFTWSTFALHILIKVNIQEMYPGIFICYYDLSQFYLNFFTYSTVVQSVLVPFSMIILSAIAFKNVRRIRAIPRQERRQIRTMNKKDFQLLRCLYIQNIIYITCNIVLSVGIVYATAIRYETATPLQQALNNFLNNFGSVLHDIPYCTNFITFICVSKAFRLEVKRLIFKMVRKDLTTIREEENNQQEAVKDNIELNHAISTIDVNA